VLLPSNPACVLVQMSAKTLDDAPAYRRMSRHSLGGVAMSRIASVPQSVASLLDEVGAGELESTQVQLVHRGTLILDQGGRQTSAGAGELIVYDVSRPFEFIYPEEFRTTIVQLPTRSVGVTGGELDAIARRAVAPDSSVRATLTALLRTADAENDKLSDTGRRALSRAIAEAVQLVIRERRGAVDAVTARSVLAESARAAARQRLDDPSLSAATLAGQLHVSVRTLHAAFEDGGQTLGQFIRAQRISQARSLLVGTSLPVRSVAEQVGYLDVTHFIRTFKTLEGATPAVWRRHRFGAAR
jgi:AraC-like DNA-binding protein